MSSYIVNDMTCGHCVSTITRALMALDPQARVNIDLERHLVQVDSAVADDARIQAALVDAGYTPEPAELAAAGSAAPSGGCCGGCGGH